MSDSSGDDEPLPKRMCATRAKSQLGASEKLLRNLACQRVTNPCYSRAAPMRMYDTSEVQEALQKADADRKYREQHRDTIQAEKVAKHKVAAKHKSELAAQACAEFSKKSSAPQTCDDNSDDSIKLPLDVWSVILEKLCPTALSAIEAPSTIARNIILAQCISHTTYAASMPAWHALAALVQADHKAHATRSAPKRQPPRPLAGMWAQPAAMWELPWHLYVANPLHVLKKTLDQSLPWDKIVSAPLTIKNDVLKTACRALGEQVSGVKAVLVLRLLHYFGVERPSAVPAVVLLAVKCEKIRYASTQAKQSSEVRFAVSLAFKHHTQRDIDSGCFTMFDVRKVLASQFASMTSLLDYASRFRPQAVPQPLPNKQHTVMCGCGNQSALTCQQSCCKNCCRGPCARHKH